MATEQQTRRRTDHPSMARLRRFGNQTMEVAEGLVYVGIAVVLILTALALLALAFGDLLALVRDPGQDAALDILDGLLLIFIVVELLYAVRATVARRELVAEPFLLVGVIASIKEIVVLSVKAAESAGQPEFSDQLWEVGVLGGLLLALGFTLWLLRLKEREPEEGKAQRRDDGPDQEAGQAPSVGGEEHRIRPRK
jgi:uncharacterized membrane protein (DUF373 family)